MWTVTNPTGRLITVVWASMRNVEEVQAYRKEVMALILTVGRPVVCCDWTQCNVMPPDVATETFAILSSSNPHAERVALLLSPDRATFNLQAERLVRDAKNPQRRTFRERSELLAWVGEVLNKAELRAAEQLYRGSTPP